MKKLVALIVIITFYSCKEISQEEQNSGTETQYKLVVKDSEGKTFEQKITKEEADAVYGRKNDSLNEPILSLGTWIHEKDKNAGLQITNTYISLFYRSNDAIEHDWYRYYITNNQPKADIQLKSGEFLYLIHRIEKDTLSYEILNDGKNDLISLLHLDSGKVHVYNKER